MGVYLCLGQEIWNLNHSNSVSIQTFSSFKAIQDELGEKGKVFIHLGEGQHKIKRKAEQMACSQALTYIRGFEEKV